MSARKETASSATVIGISAVVSLLLVLVLVAVMGRDKVNAVGVILADKPLTVVFTPGARITVNGAPVSIQGFESCPKPNPAFYKFVGSDIPAAGSKQCALIARDTSVVSVSLALPAGATTEHWKVRHEGNGFVVLRPDGSPIVGASNEERPDRANKEPWQP